MGPKHRMPRSRAGADHVLISYSRKEAQLCRQAYEAITTALSTMHDDDLLDIEVLDVQPAPDASRLSVVVRAPQDMKGSDVLAKLEKISGFLRSEVAIAIQRKRVPAFCYSVVTADAAPSHVEDE